MVPQEGFLFDDTLLHNVAVRAARRVATPTSSWRSPSSA